MHRPPYPTCKEHGKVMYPSKDAAGRWKRKIEDEGLGRGVLKIYEQDGCGYHLARKNLTSRLAQLRRAGRGGRA